MSRYVPKSILGFLIAMTSGVVFYAIMLEESNPDASSRLMGVFFPIFNVALLTWGAYVAMSLLRNVRRR